MWFATLPAASPRIVSSASSGLSSTSRISICSYCSIGSAPWKREVEGRADARLPFGPYTPAVLVDNALHQREAYAGSGKLGGVVQALEHAEELRAETRVESGAIVPHKIDV